MKRASRRGRTSCASPRAEGETREGTASCTSLGRSAIPRRYLIIVRVRPHLSWKIFGDGLLAWAIREEAEKAAEAYREALPNQEWKVVPLGET